MEDENGIEALKTRLLQFAREKYAMGMSKFEDYCKLNRGTISSFKKKGPSADILMRISSKCPELNVNWLIGIEDEMIRGTHGRDEKIGPTIPLLPFSAVAGSLSENTPIDAMLATEKYVVPDFTARGADCAIRVDGDSMYPRYSNGEILAIRVIKDPTFFQWGKVYVLSTNQGCVIKRLFPDPEDKEGIICHSENTENYPDYAIKKTDIYGVAIVVGHAGIE